MKALLGLALLLSMRPAAAQTRSARFAYANDFFTGTDRYHTQGLALDWQDPALGRSAPMRLLPALPGGERAYGLSVRHAGFTPSRLDSDAALSGDRPFAAYLFLGHALSTRDRERGLTLSAELATGVIGQGAGGKWMQKGIHRTLGNLQPRGWDNQVRNDVVLDYRLRLEKDLAQARAGAAGVYAAASAGTLHTHAAAGLTGRAGGRGLFLTARGEGKLVGYDATLQGGPFNRRNPYTLSKAQVERLVLRADIGVVLDRGSWALEATRTFLSREFEGGLSHQWLELALTRRFLHVFSRS